MKLEILSIIFSKERAHFQDQLRKMINLYEERLQKYIYESETKHQMEMDEIDERKTNQIVKLIEEHESSSMNMRNYFTDIVQNNLELIASLKEQMEKLSEKLDKSERQLKKVKFSLFFHSQPFFKLYN